MMRQVLRGTRWNRPDRPRLTSLLRWVGAPARGEANGRFGPAPRVPQLASRLDTEMCG